MTIRLQQIFPDTPNFLPESFAIALNNFYRIRHYIRQAGNIFG
jgi:hypothetical protein